MRTLFREVLYPVYHWARRDGVNQAVHGLERNQWLPAEELQLLQRKKLERILAFASERVPYYRKLFHATDLSPNRLAEPKTFARIPPLTKKIINDNRRSLVSDDLRGNRLIGNSTSGSTGEALYFYTDQRSTAFRKAAEIRGRIWAGWQLGDRMISLWGSPIDEKLRTSLRGKLHGWITQHKLISSYDLSTDAMNTYIHEILDFEPVLLVSYPGPLDWFAKYCREKSVKFPTLRGIITSAETLWPHQRSAIEAAFGVPVLDRYGCREFGLIAQECQVHAGLHVNIDRVYLEVVDENGQPCAHGVSGRLLVTDLDNFGSPMIRYQIGDNAAWADSSLCKCGRNFPRLMNMDGRTLEVVCTPTGNRIGGTFWTLLFRSRPGIKQFQVVQDQIGGVQIKFIRDDTFDQSGLLYFETNIKEKCGIDFMVEFKEVDKIELTKAGKRRLIISNCASNSSLNFSVSNDTNVHVADK